MRVNSPSPDTVYSMASSGSTSISSVTTVNGASSAFCVEALNSAGGAQIVCSPTDTKIATTPRMMAPIPPRDFKTCHLCSNDCRLAHHVDVTRLAFHHSSNPTVTAPLESARSDRSCRNVVYVADKPSASRTFGTAWQHLKGRFGRARNQLAGRRAQQQFTVPDPEDYPNTPIVVEVDEVASDSPVVVAAEVVSRPIRTGFLLTV